MKYTGYFNNKPALIFIAPILGALCLIFLLGQKFNYFLHVPSAYRVIYIPVYFWLACLAYLFVTHRFFLKERQAMSSYIRKGVFLSFFLHLYLLLGNFIIHLFGHQGPLSDEYVLYIKTVFLFSTALICLIATKQILFNEKRDITKPLLYAQWVVSALYFLSYNALLRHFNFAVAIACFVVGGAALSCIKTDYASNFIKKLFSKDLNIIIAVFILAFIVRVAFGVILVNKTIQRPEGYDGYLYASDDALTYDATANKILEEPSILLKGEVKIWGHWHEFYSIFLALLYKMFGRNFYIITCIQAALGAFIPVFIFLIGRMLFSRTAGLIASVLLSFKGGLIMLSAYMGHEAAWLPILYLFALLLTRYFKRPELSTTFRDVLMGVTLGVLSLFRAMYFYLLPFMCIWDIAFFRKIKIMKRLRHLLIISLICMVIILSVFYVFKNKMHSAEQANKAEILWDSSRLIPPFQYLGNDRLEAIGVSPVKDLKGSLIAIKEHPIRFLILAVKLYPLRIVAYLEVYQFGFFDPIYMVNPSRIKSYFASTLEFYFTLFFLAGLIGCFFKKDILNSPVFLVLAFHIAFFCFLLAHQTPRLKEISSPLVYLIGSFGAYKVYGFLSTKSDATGK